MATQDTPLDDPDQLAQLQSDIRRLANEKNALILAHNYMRPEIQDVAHKAGDSLELARDAQQADAGMIVFCGVHFMAEAARILNPDKLVLLPNLYAGCALADAITPESLAEYKERYPDHTVVTYINSTAAVKAMSDICCTSGNAVNVVRSLDNDKVLFTPDRNLGAWVQQQVPEKDVVVYDGCCPSHDVLRAATVRQAKNEYGPDAVVIAHPECRAEVLELADEICSTSGMIAAVDKYPKAKTFIIATEVGMLHRLESRHPDRTFVVPGGNLSARLHCLYMKVTTLEQVKSCLELERHPVDVDPAVARGAKQALERMLAVPRD